MQRDVQHALGELASAQHGVVSRRQLLQLGVTRWQIKAELRARRCKAHGRQTVAIHTGDLNAAAMRWYAVFEAGPRAAIDGVSSLEAAGLKGFHSDSIRTSVPRGAPAVRRKDLTVRQTRRLSPSDVVSGGVPRVRTEIAAIHAALWAVSDRQAATILAMTVQQRLATAEALGRALLDVKRDKRRRFLQQVVLDLVDGAQALSELEFARLCRAYGLPKPDKQVVRKTKRGRIYLDCYWLAYGLVAEIDGIQHGWVQASVPDALRQNDVSLRSATVLRLPLLGLRVAESEFMDQIRQGLIDGGWDAHG